MNIEKKISEIKCFLIDTFSTVDNWFYKTVDLRNYRPTNSGWTINEILEHISLTNHFLLILIDKGTNKALQNIHHLNLQTELKNHVFHWEKLSEIGMPQSFTWTRPEHMEPTGNKSPNEVRKQLQEQLTRCLYNLERMKNGEGVLFKTTMTVNNLGKINVYEYIYFLAQHAQRHVVQMQGNEAEFTSLST